MPICSIWGSLKYHFVVYGGLENAALLYVGVKITCMGKYFVRKSNFGIFCVWVKFFEWGSNFGGRILAIFDQILTISDQILVIFV